MLRITLAATLVVLSLPLRAGCPLSRFDGPPMYAQGTILAVADFNEDGRPDVLSGRAEDSTLHLNLGAPGGSLRRTPPIAITTQLDRIPVAFDATTGDFNEDGLLDFALVAASPGSIQVHLGRGNGTFEPARVINYQWDPRAIATGDFDGDGHLDLASVEFNGPVDLFWGRGDGTFTLPSSIPLAARGLDVEAADFNADGRTDLVLGRIDATEVRLANADRTFGAPHELRHSGRFGMVARDVNQDGKLDVAIADLNDFLVSIYPGRGDGTFAPRIDYDAGDTTEGIAFGEVTGDAFEDIIVGNSVRGTVVVLPGVGRGLFGPPVAWRAGYNVWGVFVADMNADGLDDILASEPWAYTVLTQSADHQFEQQEVLRLAGLSFDVDSADFNGDGHADLAVAEFDSSAVSLFRGGPDGRLVPSGWADVGLEPLTVDLVDMNADGRADLVVGIRGGVSVSIGRSDGLFDTRDITPLASNIRYVSSVGDFDDDGDPDVLALDRIANTIELLSNRGDGRLSGSGRELQVSRVPSYALLVDVNGDGKNDLVTAEDPYLNQFRDQGFMTIRLGNGNGTFGPPREHPTGSEPSHIAAADFDGDGATDLAVADFSLDGAVYLFKGSRNGSFAEAGRLIGYGQAEELALADFDNDGDTDVAFSNAGRVYVYENLGGFRFGEPLAHLGGDSPRTLTAADFNGDGRIDIATAGFGGEVSLQLNESACRRRSARR